MRAIVHATCTFASDDEQGGPRRELPRFLPAGVRADSTPPVDARLDVGPARAPPRSVLGARLVEVERFSSEDEEDRRYPDSIRARMKRIHREVLSADFDLEEDALAKRFRSLSVEPVALATPTGGADNTVDACVQGLRTLSLGGASVKSFPCPRCGHVFAQKKTREMHKKVCRG